MNVIATIEARMTSSRLPGKVMLPAAGRPMLSHLITRLQTVPSLSGIVLATTTNADDDVLVGLAENHAIMVHRGSEDDVLDRVSRAAESVDADVIVGITADCPIIDPEVVEQTIRFFMANDVDYASNSWIRSFPDGMDTDVVRAEVLATAAQESTDTDDREHPFLFIGRHSHRFSRAILVAPPSQHWPGLGLTLDEQSDYELICTLIEDLSPIDPLFGCGEAIRYLKANPDLQRINSDVPRRNPAQ